MKTRIELKGVVPFLYGHLYYPCLTTNHGNPIRIDNGKRRAGCTTLGDKNKNNSEFLEQLLQDVEDNKLNMKATTATTTILCKTIRYQMARPK